MSCLSRLLPPYYKYAVFAFCGFELLLTAIVLAIAEAYYKKGNIILPIFYQIFNVRSTSSFNALQDTMQKKVPGFTWTDEMQVMLDTYHNKLAWLWGVAAVGVTMSMLYIIPQFFDYNDSKGNRSQLCLVRRHLGLVLTWIILGYVVLLGIVLVWTRRNSREYAQLFHEKYNTSVIEKRFKNQIMQELRCVEDDDHEVHESERCDYQARAAMMIPIWLDGLLGMYIIGHILVILAIPFLNRQLIKEDDDDDESLYGEKRRLEG